MQKTAVMLNYILQHKIATDPAVMSRIKLLNLPLSNLLVTCTDRKSEEVNQIPR